MLYFEDFLEGIDGLSEEVKTRLTEMRVLDLKAQNIEDCLNSKRESFFSKVEKGVFNSYEEQRQAEQTLIEDNEELIRLRSEKEEIAKRLHEKISKCCLRMRGELDKFKMELEADHPGVTDRIERDVMNLVTKGNSTHLRGERKRHRGRCVGRPGSIFTGTRHFNKTSSIAHSLYNSNDAGEPPRRLTVRIPVTAGMKRKRARAYLDGLSTLEYEGRNSSSSLYNLEQSSMRNSSAAISRHQQNSLSRGSSNQVTPRTPTLILTPSARDASGLSHDNGAGDGATSRPRVRDSLSDGLAYSASHKAASFDLDVDTLAGLMDRNDDAENEMNRSLMSRENSTTAAYNSLYNMSQSVSSSGVASDRPSSNITSPATVHSMLMHDSGGGLDEYSDVWTTGGALEKVSIASATPPHAATPASSAVHVKRRKHRNKQHHQTLNASFSDAGGGLLEDTLDSVDAFDRNSVGQDADKDEEVFCLCRQVSFGEMVACDAPTCPYEWFHFPCVKLTAAPRGKWYCPNCRGRYQSLPGALGGSSANDAPEEKVRKRHRKHRG